MTHRETKKEAKRQDNKSRKPEPTKDEDMERSLPKNTFKTSN